MTGLENLKRVEPLADKPLLILSCSATKVAVRAHHFVPFAELYDGPMWRQVKASGFPLRNVAAISALYGFIEPWWRVQAYDCEMDEKRSRAFCRTGDDRWRLADLVKRVPAAFVVGGGMYQALAVAAVQLEPAIGNKVSFARGSFLEQRKQLGEWLRAWTATPAAAAAQLELFGEAA